VTIRRGLIRSTQVKFAAADDDDDDYGKVKGNVHPINCHEYTVLKLRHSCVVKLKLCRLTPGNYSYPFYMTLGEHQVIFPVTYHLIASHVISYHIIYIIVYYYVILYYNIL